MILTIDKKNIDLTTLGINFDLSSQQIECLHELYGFTLGEGFGVFSLKGYAGVGKTTIIKVYLEILRRTGIRSDNVAITGPTHKSKIVLEKLSGKLGKTIHSICSLFPNVNVEKLSLDNLQFDPKAEPTIPSNGVLICDESSMINDLLYEILTDFCSQVNCKIIFLGDEFQLKPVGQNHISKSFDNTGYSLTQIQRQKDGNPLLETTSFIRENINNKDTLSPITQLNEKGEGVEFVDNMGFVDKLFEEFTSNPSDRDHVRALAFQNSRVQQLNNLVREIRGFDQNISQGDLIMLYDTVVTSKSTITLPNSSDYELLKVEQAEIQVLDYELEGYSLQLESDRGLKYYVFLLDPETSIGRLEQIGNAIEEYRLDAIDNKKLWWRYFNLKDSFCSFQDIKNSEGRVIKNKSVDYGYALTIHKSQGSTFNTVLVDAKDIEICRDPHLQNQLMYVGLSRASKKAIVLI